MNKKLFLFGLINSVWMYLVYPANNMLEAGSNFFGFAFTIAFLLGWFVQTATNVFVYSKTIKDKNELDIHSWLILLKGIFVGSLGTIAVLLCISATETFKEYTYINCTIPFRLTAVEDLKYFLFVIVYVLFSYELSRKLYICFQKRYDKAER